MTELEFEWDESKNRSNQKKHGVSFNEAKTVFIDEFGRLIPDPDHSNDEDRFILLGMSFKLKTLVICHCFRQEEKIVRIISARKADKDEEQVYWRDRK